MSDNNSDKFFFTRISSGEYKKEIIWNVLGILVSLAITGTLVGLLIKADADNDRKKIASYGISLAVFLIYCLTLSLIRVDPYVKNGDSTGSKILTSLFLGPSIVPYAIFEVLINGTSNAIGKSSETGGVFDASLENLSKKYSGRFTQIKNLGDDDSGFIILNQFRMSKRGGVLPCDGETGKCKVRRSVVYMIFYLAVIILVPVFITLGESPSDDKFQISQFLGYLNLFLAITFALAIIFVLGTIKNAAGSSVYSGAAAKTYIETQEKLS
jgi:hypothetical protein